MLRSTLYGLSLWGAFFTIIPCFLPARQYLSDLGTRRVPFVPSAVTTTAPSPVSTTRKLVYSVAGHDYAGKGGQRGE